MKRALQITALLVLALLATFTTVKFVSANGNQSPVANNDAYQTDEDTTLTVDPPGVTLNDQEPDGDWTTVTVSDAPDNGTLELYTDGAFVYTPDANFNGVDTFAYLLDDGKGGTDAATVTITVNAISDGPPIATADAYAVNEDDELTVVAPGVLGNDTDTDDPCGDPKTAVLVDDVENGTLTLNADGSFTYAPDADYNGEDTFTYYATDGEDSETVTVTLTVNPVNDAPVAVNDSYTTDEDVAISVDAPGVLDNDSDIDGDEIECSVVDDPEDGAVTMDDDGSFVYTPDEDFNGEDSFTYSVTDGDLTSNTVTVTITVTPMNDAPVAVNDEVAVDEDDVLISATPGVMTNDSDIDGDDLVAVVDEGPTNGGLIFEADGAFVYTPDADFNGQDTFTYHLNDGNVDSNVATVTITVNAVNDAPEATGETYDVDEDDTLTVNAPGLLDNDSDIDGDDLSTVLEDDVTNGTLTLGDDGSFTYTPDENWSGEDSFTYYVTDDEEDSEAVTVTITVNNVDDAPTAQDVDYVDAASINEDSYLLQVQPGLLLYCDDVETDWDDLSIELVTGPSHAQTFHFYTGGANGAFYYKPVANFNGTDTFTYRVFDGALYSAPATVTINVIPVNDAPVAVNDTNILTQVNESVEIDVLDNDTDIDGDSLEVNAITVDGENGTATIINDGADVEYAPDEDFTGTDTFTYEISDGNGGTDTAVVTVRVNATPDAVNDNVSVDEDDSVDVSVLDNDTDADAGDTLSVTAITQGANGTVVDNGDGTITYTPDANWNGNDSFTYTISDGFGGEDTATVNVTVDPGNDAPVAVDDSDVVNEDSSVEISVLDNDTDIDLDVLSVSAVTQGTSGTVTITGGGTTVTYTPNANFYGVDSFTYTASDGGLTDTATVYVTVNSINDDPTIMLTNPENGDEYDEPADIVISADVNDIDGTVVLVEFYKDGVKLGSDATSPFNLSWDGVAQGEYDIQAKATDNNGGTAWSNIATVTIHNAAPQVAITAPTAGASFLTGASTTVQATASDPGGVEKVVFYLDGNLLGEDNTSPYSVSWNGMTAGEHELTARAYDFDGLWEETDPVVVTVADPVYQPDMGIRATGELVYIGENVYGNAEDQVKSLTTSTGLKAVYYVELDNDGNAADTFTITGTAGEPGWDVAYFNRANEQDITGSVVDGGWSTGVVQPGGNVRLRVEVTSSAPQVAKWVDSGSFDVDITATSQGDSSTDAVRASTTQTAPLVGVNLTADLPSPQPANTAIELTATANGGGSVEYRFFKKAPGETVYTQIQAYSNDNTCGFNTLVPGAYSFIVWAREAGSSTKKAATLNYTFTTGYKADLGIRVSPELVYVGEDVYSPTEQKKVRATTGELKVVYYLELDNDGTMDDEFLVTGGAGDSNVSVAYFDRSNETNITADVTSGGWLSPMLQPGETVRLRVEVTKLPGGTWAVDSFYNVSVTATSMNNGDVSDTVIASTQMKAALSSVALAANPVGTQTVGQPITLTATPTNGGTVEYRFFKKGPADLAYVQIQAYSTSNTAVYTPDAPGTYSFLVWARDAGSATKKSATLSGYQVTGDE